MTLIHQIKLQLEAQEPWPKDVKLYQPYEVEQILLPDNANCLALKAFLKICCLDFDVEYRPNAEFMSPSGKVPFIKCGAFIKADFDNIIEFVNERGISLTNHLDNEQKSKMRGYISLMHNVFENAELYLCYCDEETYNQFTKPRNGCVYPWPLNHFYNWNKRSTAIKKLKIMGYYGKTLEEVHMDIKNACESLSEFLGENEYFFGSKPTELDALVFGHLYTILTTPLTDTHFAKVIKSKPLIELVKRIETVYFSRD